MALLTIDPRREPPDANLRRRQRLNGASRPAFSAAATSPLDNDRTGNHQTEENQHHD
jgi:hypothetical protein